MGELKEIADRLMEVNKKVAAAIVEVTKEAEKIAKKASEELDKDFAKYQKAEIEKVFKQVVDDFYADYTPVGYHRNNSLYNLLNLPDGVFNSEDHEQDYLDIYDPDQITRDRKGSGSLFETVFIQGYHGGAMSISSGADIWGAHPHPGVAYWRTRGMVTYPDGTKKLHRYGRWKTEKAAQKNPSPYKDISEQISSLDSEGGTWDAIYNQLRDKELSSAKEIIDKKLVELVSKALEGVL